jgi:HD-GYP domain-containing protein (c-di-GMP phosphodiesterase class II)
VWERRAPLGATDWEVVRLHPYHAGRVLGRCEALPPLHELAATDHERLDASGYHRGPPATLLPLAAPAPATT